MKGIDIYSDTIITDWNAVKSSVDFVYIKLTDGLTYNNPMASEQYKAAKSVGLKVGAYHFAEKNNVLAEYSHFVTETVKYQWDLKPALDYEITTNPDFNFIAQFMSRDPNLLLYGPHSIVDKTGLPKSRIWIAEPVDILHSNYSVPVTVGEYAGIQYEWYGKVNGLEGNADVDLFSNSILVNDSNHVIGEPTQLEQSGNPAVRTIQIELNTLLKKNLAIDSIKGPLTTSAIKEFQSAMALKVDGIWGPKTTEAANEIYSRPTDGVSYAHEEYATRYIQYRVGGSIDGMFGNRTKVNVQNWQARHTLKVDGIVGKATWSKLLDENV